MRFTSHLGVNGRCSPAAGYNTLSETARRFLLEAFAVHKDDANAPTDEDSDDDDS